MCCIPTYIMQVATLIAYIIVLIAGFFVLAGGAYSFKDGFMTYLGINEVLFSFSIIIGVAILGFGIIGIIGNQRKKINILGLSIFALLVLFIGVIGMAVHVFVARQNFLPNDPDGPPLPDCHQEYQSFNDLVHTYQQVGTFFCKSGCPCNYAGTFTNADLRVNKYGSSKTQQCFEFRNLPNISRAAALLDHVERTYKCSGLCTQVFPIYYFSDVNQQEGPVTLRCDGKLRLFVDKSSLSIAGMHCAAAIALLLALCVIISNFCHSGFYIIFPNQIENKREPLAPPPLQEKELKQQEDERITERPVIKRTPSFEIVTQKSGHSTTGIYHIQTISDSSRPSYE